MTAVRGIAAGVAALVLAASALLASPPARAELAFATRCGPEQRNRTQDVRGRKRLESRDGEFAITLPFARQRVEQGGFGRTCFHAINIDDRSGGGGHLSIEWVALERAPSGDALEAFWRSIQAGYLRTNFGDGGYEVVAAETVEADGRREMRFAGNGRNNGGAPGAVVGVASSRGARLVVVYSVLSRPLGAGDEPLRSAAWRQVEALAASLDCTSPACADAAPDGD